MPQYRNQPEMERHLRDLAYLLSETDSIRNAALLYGWIFQPQQNLPYQAIPPSVRRWSESSAFLQWRENVCLSLMYCQGFFPEEYVRRLTDPERGLLFAFPEQGDESLAFERLAAALNALLCELRAYFNNNAVMVPQQPAGQPQQQG